jgi:hypothetical protein
MNIDGIWQIDMLGIYGWESLGAVFLENGRYLGGGPEHYSVGRYSVDGSKVKLTSTLRFIGRSQPFLGKTSDRHELSFEGKIKGDKIEGKATDVDGEYQVVFRGRRLADLPTE